MSGQVLQRSSQNKEFSVCDLVLQEILPPAIVPIEGKLHANWDGPYKVIETTQLETYHLEDMQEKCLPHPQNPAHLKHYH